MGKSVEGDIRFFLPCHPEGGNWQQIYNFAET